MWNRCYLTCLVVGIFGILSAGQEDEFEKLTGFKGKYNQEEGLFRVAVPRTDVTVTVDQAPLDPFLGLTSWAAFKRIDENRYLVMGDLVLFQDEVNPVISTLLENHIEITALHNHFFYDLPKVYFMHIAGTDTAEHLAKGVKDALATISEIRSKTASLATSFGGLPLPPTNTIDLKTLETEFNTPGEQKNGLVKFTFGRGAKMGQTSIGSGMGLNTWAAFRGTDENAIVDGDFAVTEKELQIVLDILRKGGINIVAIHNHMVGEEPRILFIHYWGQGKAQSLAATIKKAIGTVIVNNDD